MSFFRKKPPLNRRSQIAVIITFVIAVILLFIAVFINLAKVSQVKTTTSTAADKAALGLASQLGSMSHYYKDKVLGGQTEKTAYSWLALVLVLVGSIAGGMFIISPVVFLTGMGALVSMSMSTAMLDGISDRFNKDMTAVDALRENTLFGALFSTQSDDVELTRVGAGIFRDKTTGKDYDLSTIPEMRNANKVGRFAAWYYALRIPLVSDDDLKDALDTFKNGLKRFIAIDEWDNTKWKINKFSYIIEPGPAQESANYEITCTSCPSWVRDVNQKQIAIMKIDATQPEGSSQVTGGFLKDKLISLLSRLETSYNLTFCDATGCSDVDKVIEDLRMFLFRSKEVVDTPTTAALNSITQWFPFFYDSAQHNLDKSSIDGDLEDDAYERLTRDQNNINTWITELETLNSLIRGTIPSVNGHNQYGKGSAVSSCYTQYNCCASDCSRRCCEASSNCSFQGIYCSACGSSTPPVCVNGDLYGVKPSWCPLNNRSASCNSSCSSCSRNPQCSSDCNFQGQLAYNNTSGPTEVEQALKILRDLNYDIGNIKKNIGDYVDAQIKHATPTCLPGGLCALKLRNEIVYAWKSKPDQTGKQYNHFVQVAIEGYPDRLPYISENIEWGGLQKRWKLESGTGDFKIMVWRYDQDQPTDIAGSKLKRRKTPGVDEFPLDQLKNIVADVQDNGKIDSTQSNVDSILGYAITSCSKAHYGPKKSDIYITGTQCD